MSRRDNAPTVVIKRKKIVGHGDHHGGAWKVAFADFATAMMAFFLIMWLINAASDAQREGLAAHFAPTVPVSRAASGLDGLMDGRGLTIDPLVGETTDRVRIDPDHVALDPKSPEALEAVLQGWAGESRVMEQALRHVVTRVTDEGLIVELHDLPGRPLFDPETDSPLPVLTVLAEMIAGVFAPVDNGVAVAGHTRAYPVVRRGAIAWDLSTSRAHRMREMLEVEGLDARRLARVTGHGDRDPATRLVEDVRNNRLEVILLRDQR